MPQINWLSIEICKVSRGYMVIVTTPASKEYANTPDGEFAFSTIEEVAAWLESQGIRRNPPGRKD